MNSEMLKCSELYKINLEEISSRFPWEGRKSIAMAAEYFTEEGITADISRMKDCEKIIRENTGFLSPFRGHLKMVLICKMYEQEAPEEFFLNIKDAGAEEYLRMLLESDDLFAEYLRAAMESDFIA